MSTDRILAHFQEAQSVLNAFVADEQQMANVALAAEHMVNAIRQGGKIISCGNGGSMSDAMHFAEELTGRYRDNRPSLPAIAISDPSYLSCTANDYGYEHVFSRFVQGMGQPGDVLLAISTSGNSGNVINAAEMAKAQGLAVIGLTGKTGGKLAPLCDVEIRAPQSSYADRVQEIHIKVIHALIDSIEVGVASA
ncbi:MAG: D-sedoheptulose 7-phosphate isomerase [Salibacteraceae bacterium]